MPEVFFKQIYGQREQVPRVVVIDGVFFYSQLLKNDIRMEILFVQKNIYNCCRIPYIFLTAKG